MDEVMTIYAVSSMFTSSHMAEGEGEGERELLHPMERRVCEKREADERESGPPSTPELVEPFDRSVRIRRRAHE